MNTEILVFDSCQETALALASEIQDRLKGRQGELKVICHDPTEVFLRPLQKKPLAAFFALSGMYDLEAARKFHATQGDVPLVIVSNSGEYALMSYDLGACDYLIRSINTKSLSEAINRCLVSQAE